MYILLRTPSNCACGHEGHRRVINGVRYFETFHNVAENKGQFNYTMFTAKGYDEAQTISVEGDNYVFEGETYAYMEVHNGKA